MHPHYSAMEKATFVCFFWFWAVLAGNFSLSLWRIISFVKKFSPFGCGLCKFKQTMSRKRLMVIADMLAFAKSYSLVKKGQNLAFLNILLPASVSEFLS